MSQKISNLYHYKETNNPYSNGEEIVVELIENDNGEQYYNFFIDNDDNNGCGIFLTPKQVIELADKLTLKIDGYV